VYDDLSTAHSGSRAAAKVPDRLKTFYTTVAGAYAQKNYCDAIPQLKYLRTVPGTIGKKQLGSLATWPDDRLATSLYECGSTGLAAQRADWSTSFGDLLATFPESSQAGQVEPAVKSAVTKGVQGVTGSQPCTAVEELQSLSTQIDEPPGRTGGRGRRARCGRPTGGQPGHPPVPTSAVSSSTRTATSTRRSPR
jgi:hypothetical protein